MLPAFISYLNSIIWGIPSIVLFCGGFIYLTVKTRFVQFRRFGRSYRLILRDIKAGKVEGGVSPVSALMASLAAVMGPGNLVGVCSAILLGGSGAVFWMCLSAVFGMAARYAESTLSAMHKKEGRGGPMYVMRNFGMVRTAAVFSVAGICVSLTMANALPSGALSSALEAEWSVPPAVTGIALSVLAFVTVFGGLKRIVSASNFLIPVVSIFFLGTSLFIILSHPSLALDAAAEIFAEAFSFKAGIGGLLGGAVRYGISKGIYSNEAGMGTEPILASATNEPDPKAQGLISMTGPFLDTVVFCGITGLVMVMSGVCSGDAASMTARGFATFLPGCGGFAVTVTLLLLVCATVVSWSYYGESCLAYLSPSGRFIPIYRTVYCLLPIVGAMAELSLLLEISDLAMAAMAIPNIIVTMRLTSRINICC
ncbi:MAG: sodium:alanine symporter family protein [Clostridia bacterium]|nr:sodium:alanine symporter family protein [Clostridia bacterium]